MNNSHKYNPFKDLASLSGNSDWGVSDFTETRNEGSFFWFGDTTNERISVPIEPSRIRAIFVCFFIGFFILCSRSLYLQVIEYRHYASLAEHNRSKESVLYAHRGLIFDRNNKQLVDNIPQYSLWVIPSELPKKEAEKIKEIHDAIIEVVAPDEQSHFEEIFAQALDPKSYAPVLIMNNIEYAQVIKLRANTADIPGIDITARATRRYNDASTLSHVIGYVGSVGDEEVKQKGYDRYDLIGKTGIELFYEKELKGKNGLIRTEVNSSGQIVKNISRELPDAGSDITLTLDSDLQKQIAVSLGRQVRATGARGGAGIVMDPYTGEILALVSVPYFDPNILTVDKDTKTITNLLNSDLLPFFNRAVSAAYPLGSIFKLFVAAGALDTGLITKKFTVMSTGGIEVNDSFFKDWKIGGHGLTNLKKAIADSVNTFFYTIGGGYKDQKGLGVDDIDHYAKLFGFGIKPSIDLPGAVAGIVPNDEWKQNTVGDRWYLGDTYNLSIGQGYLTVSPVQVVVALAAIVNDGTLTTPHLMKSIISNDKVIQTFNSTQSQLPISRDTFSAIKEGMRETVLSGSGKRLSELTVSSAGKTATAQIGYSGRYNAWYGGYAPYEKPEVAFVFMLENVPGGGDRYAVPIASDFLQYYFSDKEKDNRS